MARKPKLPTPASRKLYAWLQEKGLSQAELCRQEGWHPLTAVHWLSGDRTPNLEQAARLEMLTGGWIRAAEWVQRCGDGENAHDAGSAGSGVSS